MSGERTRRLRSSQRRRAVESVDWSPAGLGLAPERFETMRRFLFDRPVPDGQGLSWVWDDDAVDLAATPLEWTRFQAALFANAGTCLSAFDDDQVGMGLYYIMDSGQSDVPFAAIDGSVPHEDAMRMMQAMPRLWSDCLGPRLAHLHAPIGSGAGGRLGHACYMWFDCWPTFHRLRDQAAWRDAMWTVLAQILATPFRAAQISALHGIGHNVRYLDRQAEIDATVTAFIARIDVDDAELRQYAEAARIGMVQ